LAARLTVIATRSWAAKPRPTTVRGARDRILNPGPSRAGALLAEIALIAATRGINPKRLNCINDR